MDNHGKNAIYNKTGIYRFVCIWEHLKQLKKRKTKLNFLNKSKCVAMIRMLVKTIINSFTKKKHPRTSKTIETWEILNVITSSLQPKLYHASKTRLNF